MSSPSRNYLTRSNLPPNPRMGLTKMLRMHDIENLVKSPFSYIGHTEGQDPDKIRMPVAQGNRVEGSTWDASMMFEGNDEEYNESDGGRRKHEAVQLPFPDSSGVSELLN